jgi:hypothetical protein
MLRRVPLILLIPLDRGYPDPVDTPAPDFGHRESMPLLFNGITHLGYAPQPVDHQSANRVVGTGGQLDAGPRNELVETDAGAFWEPIAAMGGPHRSTRKSVAVLSEACVSARPSAIASTNWAYVTPGAAPCAVPSPGRP